LLLLLLLLLLSLLFVVAVLYTPRAYMCLRAASAMNAAK